MKSKEELLEETKMKLRLLDAQIGELRTQEESKSKQRKREDALDDWFVRLPELEARIAVVTEGLHNLAGLEARLRDIDSEARKVAFDFERKMEFAGKIALELEKIKAGIAIEVSRIPVFDAKLSGVSAELEKINKEICGVKQENEGNKKELEQMKVHLSGELQNLRASGAEKAAKSAVENLTRKRQNILATLDTIKSGYKEKLISREDYEEIVRENERKIAEIDTRIAEMSK